MRRIAAGLGRSLAGIVAVTAVLVLGTGARVGFLLPGVLLLGLAIALSSSRLRRFRSAPDPGWAPPAAFMFVPTAGHQPAPPPTVALAIGRAEARELVASGAFGVGLGFCVAVFVVFAVLFRTDFTGELAEAAELGPIFVHPLVGLTVLAAFVARTRSVRDGCEELFQSCPTSQRTRTAGHLQTGWVPAIAAIVTASLIVVGLAIRVEAISGPMGARQVVNILGAGVLGVGGVALGVALARWLPWRIVPIVVVIAVGFATARLGTSGNRTSEPLRQLSTFLGDREVAIRFTAPHWIAHHAWIALLTAAVAVIALLRDANRRALLAALGVIAVLAAVAGVVATRPIDDGDARRIAGLIGSFATQTCTDDAVPICTYPGDDALTDLYRPHVADVLAAVPAGALAGVQLREGALVDRDDLDPEIARLLPDLDPSVVPFDLVGHEHAILGARFWLALTAVGAVGAVDDRAGGTTASLRGQARGVLAIWIATRGLDADDALDMASVKYEVLPEGTIGYGPWPDACYAGTAPVQWALSDLTAARALLAEPDAEVRAAVSADWDHLVDPSTTTDELLVVLGLEPVGRVDGFTQPTSC